MTNGQVFKHYVWIVNTLRHGGRLTLNDLNERWVNDEVADGNPLPRSSFNKYRTAIIDMFGLRIECDKCHRYYISNPGNLNGDRLKQWMLSTLTTGYQKFGFEPYTKPVDPYAVKLFHQRWYLLADNRERMSIYALDRMRSATLTEERFVRPADFSPEAYFAEYFGVITDGTPMEHVVVRAYGKMASLLRTLPLHATQRELKGGDGYTDFSIDIRPTVDFVSELMSKIDGLDVLEPASLKARISGIMEAALARNP